VCARNAAPHKVAANRISEFVGERRILLLLVTSKRMLFCVREGAIAGHAVCDEKQWRVRFVVAPTEQLRINLEVAPKSDA
jgi:hypothetical protein